MIDAVCLLLTGLPLTFGYYFVDISVYCTSQTARGAILVFLLHQATITCPFITESLGMRTQFTEYATVSVAITHSRSKLNVLRYLKFLPEELLPTFWFEAERELLTGTSLKPAVEAKLRSLEREYENLRSATERIPWCSKYWWDGEGGVDGLLSFDDWLQVDTMYRSRALEFPGIGDSMMPCIDMANHAADDETAALYETDGQGNGVLLLRDGLNIKEGDEVTIT